MDNEILDCLQNKANKEEFKGDKEHRIGEYKKVREDAECWLVYKLP
ncbi:hypothetical protein A1E_04840 [Rickettsia canadensis str. McKiel]|uniref:Uncharacterized protein n=1 Tax=Rickettsia canadensis (strain McKiel) TaxID=293613 RepID=A8EZV6_RICCK|nr:hypothetical protein A1E_04840 [Rickettsia canadensis str. McKiel]